MVVGVEAQDALGQVLHPADAPPKVGLAGTDACRHLGQRRGHGRGPRLLPGLERLVQQRAAIAAGLVFHLPGGATEPDEGVAIAAGLFVDDRLDDDLRCVLPGQQAQRLAIGGERRQPVAACQRHIAEVGMAARLIGMTEPDQLLLELEGALEDRLGRLGPSLLDVDGAQCLQRLGDARAAHAVDLLAHAHRLDVVPLRGGEIAGFLGGQAQRVVLQTGLLVVRTVGADDQRQSALGKAQRLGVVAGAIEGVRGLAQLLQLLGGLLGMHTWREQQRGQDEHEKRPPRTIGHAGRLTCRDSRSSGRRRAPRACH